MSTTATENPEFPLLAKPKISSGRLVLGCLGMALLTVVAAVTIPLLVSNHQAAARLPVTTRTPARNTPAAITFAIEQGFHFARHDGTPYRPGVNTGGLLIAPDRDSWCEIHALLLGN